MARQRRVWIVASKYEKMCILKFDTHNIIIIWYCFCRLTFESVQYHRMLDGYHNSGSFCVFLGTFKQTP